MPRRNAAGRGGAPIFAVRASPVVTPSHLPRRRLIAGWDEHPFGVGCRPIGGPATNQGNPVGWAPVAEEIAVEALLRAHAEGATVFDTSDIYGLGHSQRLLGRMLAQVPRENVRISCTVGAFKGTGLNAYSSLNLHGQVEQSLENLGVEYLDVLTLTHTDFGPGDRYLEDARETLHALRDQGDIKAIGMRAPCRPAAGTDSLASGSSARDQERGARFAYLFQKIGPEVISTSINPLNPQPHSADAAADESKQDIFGFARRHSVATMVHTPLGHGLLTGKYGPDAVFLAGDLRSRITTPTLETLHRGLSPLRERFGSDPQDLARIALHHCLRRFPDSVVLTGVSSPQQAISNFQGLKAELSDDDYDFVDAVYATLRGEARRSQPLEPDTRGPSGTSLVTQPSRV
ncbi:aldo/keto reductase [Streptomyces niveus]|uniref:aldo/keto reductase n=1 Tax=Streptomyces niveus TaxID=193462 RepID=UPI003446ED02